MLRLVSAGVLATLFVAGCGNHLDDDVDGGGGMAPPGSGGSFNGTGAGDSGGGNGGDEPEIGFGDQEAAESPPDLVCEADLAETRGRLIHRSVGGFASVQYVKASIAAGEWPDPDAIRVDDFETFFTNRLPFMNLEDPQSKLAVVAQLRQDEKDGLDKGQLDLRASWTGAETPPMDLVVLLDVSSSTEDVIAVRDELLRSLAEGVHTAQNHTLTLLTYGDVPETVLDHEPADHVVDRLDDALIQLTPKSGNNLVAALAAAKEIVEKAADTAHVLVITDGGTAWHPAIQNAVIDVMHAGGVTSIAQLGHPPEQEGLAPSFNDPLLEGVARAGLGTRLYISPTTPGDIDPVRARYQELFSVVSTGASVEVILPPGIVAVERAEAPFAPADAIAARPMAFAPFASSIFVQSLCLTAFDSPNAVLEVEVYQGDSLVGSGKTTLITQEPKRRLINDQLQLLVQGLRIQSSKELHDAKAGIQENLPQACAPLEEDGSCGNEQTSLCCVSREIIALIDASCDLFGEADRAVCLGEEANPGGG